MAGKSAECCLAVSSPKFYSQNHMHKSCSMKGYDEVFTPGTVI